MRSGCVLVFVSSCSVFFIFVKRWLAWVASQILVVLSVFCQFCFVFVLSWFVLLYVLLHLLRGGTTAILVTLLILLLLLILPMSAKYERRG